MISILALVLRKFVVVFIDDVLIYIKNCAEHLQHIKQVFALLQQHQFKVKLSKCSFTQTELTYLWHVISAQGVATDPGKIAIVRDWPTPLSVKDVRSFLGLAGYYRKFVQEFGAICKPLTSLLKKGTLFVWTSEQESSFQALKNALISVPVLAMPDLHKPFLVETDASDKGIGAMCNKKDTQWHMSVRP